MMFEVVYDYPDNSGDANHIATSLQAQTVRSREEKHTRIPFETIFYAKTKKKINVQTLFSDFSICLTK